jgi:hypothetical protein
LPGEAVRLVEAEVGEPLERAAERLRDRLVELRLDHHELGLREQRLCGERATLQQIQPARSHHDAHARLVRSEGPQGIGVLGGVLDGAAR